MNFLRSIHSTERRKFASFAIGVIFKMSGFVILFVIDWKIGLGVFLVERGAELLNVGAK